MTRALLVLLLMLAQFSVVAAPRRRAVQHPQGPAPAQTGNLGDPVRGLTAAQLAAWLAARGEFNEDKDVAGGLGPIFNDVSCLRCHSVPVAGGSNPRGVTLFGRTMNGVFDPMTAFGGPVLQEHALGPEQGMPPFQRELVPPQATIVTQRRTTPLFGLGFVDATPDATFIALAAEQAARNPATAGRVAFVTNFVAGTPTVGKFGWKAQVPSLFQFAGDAFRNEMGMTSAEFPNENCANGNCNDLARNPAPGLNDTGDGVRQLTDFMLMLGAPSRGLITADATAGEQVFQQLGCNQCHVPNLTTGSHPIAALSNKIYSPYSDFLLHDMGALGDGIVQGAASGRELRTAPLWGLRAQGRFLHDGRANNINDAIAAHDGQARTSREAYQQLDAQARARLLAFLNSL
ncbi:MAG TPA: di-heme oxidoredictase family protein [Thermoanaerobaculia bacterium]|nr:di-heme oxidoredictase family protein [Thermoanaerobaculia bacterium]